MEGQSQHYGEAAYWDERYAREPICFDWYQGWAGLEGVIRRHLRPDEPLLHVGVGTSRLQEGLVTEGGFVRVVNLDVSTVVVDQMARLHAGVAELEYAAGDVRSMPQYEDGSFGGVLDKGTLDAILCGAAPAENAAAALAECCRVLKPGGVFMLVTYGDPECRLGHLTAGLPWDVQAYVLSKPDAASAAAAEGGAPPRAVLQGPFDARDKAAMDAIGGVRDVHFIYACTKRTPGAPGGGGAAAEGGGGAAAAGEEQQQAVAA